MCWGGGKGEWHSVQLLAGACSTHLQHDSYNALPPTNINLRRSDAARKAQELREQQEALEGETRRRAQVGCWL